MTSARRDRITANLPSRDFGATATFYERLGFGVAFRDDGWMILTRGALELEFFPSRHRPRRSTFSACIRVDDPAGLHADFAAAGLPTGCRAIPRLSPPTAQHGLRQFALVDPDGSLLRCLENSRP